MNRDQRSALGRAVVSVSLGAAILYGIARWLGWGFMLGLVTGLLAALLDGLATTTRQLPTRWRPW